jgi:dihydrofolate synthase/folylpolyglutamate synthase
VHAYTSPHLVRFHERIRLAGDLIEEDRLSDILDECEPPMRARSPISRSPPPPRSWPSPKPGRLDLLEVGLGGRLDATNVVDTPLTVITPVDMDHQQFLGDTLAEIAGEKAGHHQARRPRCGGPQQDEALEVIEARAADLRLALSRRSHPARERLMSRPRLCGPLPRLCCRA